MRILNPDGTRYPIDDLTADFRGRLEAVSDLVEALILASKPADGNGYSIPGFAIEALRNAFAHLVEDVEEMEAGVRAWVWDVGALQQQLAEAARAAGEPAGVEV